MITQLSPTIQEYEWGSRTALPELCGTTSPAPHPVAEHWFGAHFRGSAICADGRGLDARIAADPVGELGERVTAEHGRGLPYLVKLLAAEQALSLQAHPSLENAREGFAAEDARGIPLDSPVRNYRDANHKPEILVALTEFHSLVGFRQVEHTVSLFDALSAPSLQRYRDMLVELPDADGLRAVFSIFVKMPPGELAKVITEVVTAVGDYLIMHGSAGRWSRVATTVSQLAASYPNDHGVISALLMNEVSLQPGEAVYLNSGQLHAYLRGVGVEVMASSDNVLRGGLTSKHVEIAELLRVLEFEPLTNPIVLAVPAGRGIPGEVDYPTPEPDFALSRIDLQPNSEPVTYRPDGPEVLLCTSGRLWVGDSGTIENLGPGRAVWVPSLTPKVTLGSTTGGTVFRTHLS